MIIPPLQPPDRFTGLPRPHPAPIVSGSGKEVTGSSQPFDIIVPPEFGPVLETYHEPRNSRWRGSAMLFGLVFLLLTLSTGGFDWMSDWRVWLCIVPPASIPLFHRRTRLAAGAQWFQSDGGGWVNLYDLESIKLSVTANSGRGVHLVDRDGRTAGASLLELQHNHELWTLVYNGMLYSYGEGAELNRIARRDLFFIA